MLSAGRKYFAASNSAEGFKNYYANVFDKNDYSKIYVIKGGPGTGKSSFMREIASRADEKGFSAILIYCSSDPASLDGVILPELKIAVLDGTPPHTYEPSIAGAVESIVDLGAFWKESTLRGSRRQIERLNDQRAECFERGYRYLSAYKRISENMGSLIIPGVKLEKIKKLVSRLVLGVSGEGRTEYLLTRSIGMNGRVSFDSYFENAEIYYRIDDYFETGHIFMRELCSALQRVGADMRISPNPVICERLDALAVLPHGATFEISDRETDSRVINMKRFVDGVHLATARGEWRAAKHLRDRALELAEREFAKLKKYHFTLEEIYGAAMDFEAKEQFCAEFCNKIFAKS